MKQSRQKTIGLNPLELYLSDIQEHSASQPAQQPASSEPVVVQDAHTRLSPVIEVLETNQEVEQILLDNQTPVVSVVEHNGQADSIADQLYAQELHGNETNASKKQRITIHIPEELIDKVKNAVYWEPGLTLAGFAQYALARTLEQFEQERGAPFPDRKTRQLRGGRPIK